MPSEITDLETDKLLQEVGAIGEQNPNWQFQKCWEEALKQHPELWRLEGDPELDPLGPHEERALPIAVVEIIQQENPLLSFESCFQKVWENYPELRKICPPRKDLERMSCR